MTVLNHRRLTNAVLKLDIDGLRRGFYSDQYFENAVRVLNAARAEGYTYAGHDARPLPRPARGLATGDLEVEAQIFNRHSPTALVAGVDVALSMIRHVSGEFLRGGFVAAWSSLAVEAVEDGVFTRFSGDSEDVDPVIRIRGAYRHFALLETPMLGVLTRATRIATLVYQVMEAANGKPVLFFPARFDLPAVQPIDGYAYWLAVQRYNHDYGKNVAASVSTDAQALWWGGRGGGTVPHALIAAYLGDTAESMLAFARYLPVEVPRIALVDFNNDVIRDSLATLDAFWPHYRAALESSDVEASRRWTLYGVRLDTSANMRDQALEPDGPRGVSPELVRAVRAALDQAYRRWDVPERLLETARAYCKAVRVVVTGGFNRDRIAQFERDGVPVDVYGVGSSLLRSDHETNADYTMDLVRVKVGGAWVELAKEGRAPNDNPDLRPIDLSEL